MPWGKGDHLGFGRLVAYLTLSSPFPRAAPFPRLGSVPDGRRTVSDSVAINDINGMRLVPRGGGFCPRANCGLPIRRLRTEKRCPSCGLTRPVEDWSHNPSRSDHSRLRLASGASTGSFEVSIDVPEVPSRGARRELVILQERDPCAAKRQLVRARGSDDPASDHDDVRHARSLRLGNARRISPGDVAEWPKAAAC